MRPMGAVAVALAALAGMGGCGDSGHRAPSSAAAAARTAATAACGDLKARMGGIDKERGTEDPQPGALVGRRHANDLRRAAIEALAADREVVTELRRTPGTTAAVRAIELTAPSYRGFARSLRAATLPNFTVGIRTGARLELLQARQFAACANALG